jgi:ADP-ribosyl-[dinitrogen reductase] hydrolase
VRTPVPVLVYERVCGGLLGLVVGDALGVPVEFCTRAERDRDPVAGMRSFGTHCQPVGAWSDDGSLTLAHTAAFLAHGWEPRRHLEAFAEWHQHGAWTAHGRSFDIGFATENAIVRFLRGVSLSKIGGRAVRNNGNGSLMRMFPVACWAAALEPAERHQLMEDASALTHAHIRSRLCCAWYGCIVAGLLARKPLHECLGQAAAELGDRVPDDEYQVFRPLLDSRILRLDRDQIRSDGYVVSTLVAACWCLHRHDSYCDAVLEAVNLGGDTDTTAAVTGSLAGLRSGLGGIPLAWRCCLARGAEVMGLVEAFADLCCERFFNHS